MQQRGIRIAQRENVSGDPAGWLAAVSSRLRLWGSWIKLCWGVTHREGDTGNEAREIFPAVIPDLFNGAAETDSHYFYCLLLLTPHTLPAFLLQILLSLGDLGFPASHYPECRPAAVLCLSHA